MSLDCIIVDDEPRAHVILKAYIADMNDVVLKGCFRNALAAYDYVKANSVDLIFLDIEMPKINGFSLLDMLNPKPMVIFTTAYINYALKSYEYHAIDYLHKPVRFERFVSAVEKARKWKQLNGESNSARFIEVKTRRRRQKLDLDKILYIECVGNYTRFFCKDASIPQTLITVKELEGILPRNFLRIHRSFIVNMDFIAGTDENSVTIDATDLPIGTTYKKYVQQNLRQ